MAEQPESTQFKALPAHVAIIMDGNGRWAAARHLPRMAGHREGTENLRRVITACVEFGIKYLTIYAFSTENWKRPQGRGLRADADHGGSAEKRSGGTQQAGRAHQPHRPP